MNGWANWVDFDCMLPATPARLHSDSLAGSLTGGAIVLPRAMVENISHDGRLLDVLTQLQKSKGHLT